MGCFRRCHRSSVPRPRVKNGISAPVEVVHYEDINGTGRHTITLATWVSPLRRCGNRCRKPCGNASRKEAGLVDGYDGASLRAARMSVKVSQARVARLAGVSVGHISRVESGERVITPSISNAYERALGFRLVEHALPPSGEVDTLKRYRPGEDADDMKRRAFTVAIAAIAAGAPLGEPIGRTLASLAHTTTPTRIGMSDVAQVEQAADMFTAWDLRFGGGLARELATAQLRWASGLLGAQMDDTVRARLNSAVGSLAERAAWSTFDAGDHDGARTLFKLAVYSATQADDADLRAHILSDVATQQLHLGHPNDCVKILRWAEGDDRICPAVRFVLHGVKARAFAAMADAPAVRRHIGLAEDAYAAATAATTPQWMTFLNDAHVYSVTGQAAFSLAHAAGTFSTDAHERLTRAITGFTGGRARAVALCATRLARLHLDNGNLHEGETAARTALKAVPGLRSARITQDLNTMRSATNRHHNDAMTALANDINSAITAANNSSKHAPAQHTAAAITPVHCPSPKAIPPRTG